MHSILFAITRPGDATSKVREWRYVAEKLSASAQTNKSIQLLGEGGCLILGADALIALGQMMSLAQEHGLPYRILVIEKATDWIAA